MDDPHLAAPGIGDVPPVPEHPGLRYPPEEIKRLGEAVFERDVRPRVGGYPPDYFLAVDAEGRGWRVGATSAAASDALRRAIPDAQIWKRRVGPAPAFHFAGGLVEGPHVGGEAEFRFGPTPAAEP